MRTPTVISFAVSAATAAVLLAGGPADATTPTPSAPASTTTATPTCPPATVATVTAAKIRRYDAKRIVAWGQVSYWSPTGWLPAPRTDYLLTLQKLVGTRWTYVTRIQPETNTYVLATAGIYRLAFPHLCTQLGAASSASKNIVIATIVTKPKPPGAVYYPNCAAVRRAGKAPLHRGQPGYRPGLDADHDGIACEPLHR